MKLFVLIIVGSLILTGCAVNKSLRNKAPEVIPSVMTGALPMNESGDGSSRAQTATLKPNRKFFLISTLIFSQPLAREYWKTMPFGCRRRKG